MKLRHSITVQCYSGYQAEESPRRFLWGAMEYDVHLILGRTSERTLDLRQFRRFHVLTTADEEFDLIQEIESGMWYVETEV